MRPFQGQKAGSELCGNPILLKMSGFLLSHHAEFLICDGLVPG